MDRRRRFDTSDEPKKNPGAAIAKRAGARFFKELCADQKGLFPNRHSDLVHHETLPATRLLAF